MIFTRNIKFGCDRNVRSRIQLCEKKGGGLRKTVRENRTREKTVREG